MRNLIILAVAAGLAAGTAVAQDGPRGGGMLRAADANNDGVVTAQESADAAAKRFDALDTDRNGTLTDAERQAGPGRGFGPGGDISRADYLARAAERFQRLDANKDGKVDAAEMQAGFGQRGN